MKNLALVEKIYIYMRCTRRPAESARRGGGKNNQGEICVQVRADTPTSAHLCADNGELGRINQRRWWCTPQRWYLTRRYSAVAALIIKPPRSPPRAHIFRLHAQALFRRGSHKCGARRRSFNRGRFMREIRLRIHARTCCELGKYTHSANQTAARRPALEEAGKICSHPLMFDAVSH